MNSIINRTINGLLKARGEVLTPETLEDLLSQDIEIVAPPARAIPSDLWPAIWALAAAAERQFFGRVFIRCGLEQCLAAPSALGERCFFVDEPQAVRVSIQFGVHAPTRAPLQVVFDAGTALLTFGALVPRDAGRPSPIECFAVAGYAGFAALALLVGLPSHRVSYAGQSVQVPAHVRRAAEFVRHCPGFSVVGLGQLGQAYLALLYFLDPNRLSGKRLALIDKDDFESPNGRTQVLLVEGGAWEGQDKGTYLGAVVKAWGADAVSRPYKLDFERRRHRDDPPLALVGVHDLEGRRIAMAAGFERVIESGVGTDFRVPRVTWHSAPGDAKLGKKLFGEREAAPARDIQADWVQTLKATPGSCGWVEFQGISATAPCLGLTAAAFALAEMGAAQSTWGRATLWSPGLPVLRGLAGD